MVPNIGSSNPRAFNFLKSRQRRALYSSLFKQKCPQLLYQKVSRRGFHYLFLLVSSFLYARPLSFLHELYFILHHIRLTVAPLFFPNPYSLLQNWSRPYPLSNFFYHRWHLVWASQTRVHGTWQHSPCSQDCSYYLMKVAPLSSANYAMMKLKTRMRCIMTGLTDHRLHRLPPVTRARKLFHRKTAVELHQSPKQTLACLAPVSPLGKNGTCQSIVFHTNYTDENLHAGHLSFGNSTANIVKTSLDLQEWQISVGIYLPPEITAERSSSSASAHQRSVAKTIS